MLATFKQDEWKEPADIDQQVEILRTQPHTPEEIRKLFPFKGIAKKRLIPYGIPEGSVLEYIRVKHEPSLYPFVGLIGVAGDTQWGTSPRRLILDSTELQLVEV